MLTEAHRVLLVPKKPYLLGVTTQTSTGTPITLTRPRYEAGVLNIALICRHAGGTAAPGTPTGFTSLTSSTTDPDFRLAYEFSTGSVGRTTTSSATSATSMSGIVLSFGGVHSSRIPAQGGVATATSTSPNPAIFSNAFTLTSGWATWLAYCMWNGNGTATGFPIPSTGATPGALLNWQVAQSTNGGMAVSVAPQVPGSSADFTAFTLSASLVNRAGAIVVRGF